MKFSAESFWWPLIIMGLLLTAGGAAVGWGAALAPAPEPDPAPLDERFVVWPVYRERVLVVTVVDDSLAKATCYVPTTGGAACVPW